MSIGAQLKKIRLAKQLKFADVTRDTRIQAWVLEALEADQLHLQMSIVYSKGFLSSYAKFLGLDPAPLLAELQATLAPPAPAKPELPPAAPVTKLQMPKLEMPKFEMPKVQMSKVELPKITLPKLVMPRVQLPKVAIPKIKFPKVEMPRFELPKLEVPWSRLRRMVPALAAAAVIALVVAINPAKQLAKIEWPKFSMPKIAIKLPASKKLAAKPKSQPQKLASAGAIKVVAKPAAVAKPAVAVSDELAKVPARLPEPQLTVAPRMASVAPTVSKPKPAALPVLELTAAQPLELVLITNRATFVQVRADGKLLASRQLPRGSKERWTASRTLDLVVAHPTDVELKLNGQSISPFAVAYRGRMRITHRGVVQLAAASE